MEKWQIWKKQYGAKVIFTDYYQPMKANVIDVLQWYKEQGKRIAIWGGGIKGTAFLQIVDLKGKYIDYVIDIKAEKTGQYIVGREIISCYDLKDKAIDVIIMMNQKHFVQNYNILKDEGIECILHDMDEIVKRKLSVADIKQCKDMENDQRDNEKQTKRIQKELMPLLHEVKRVCEKNNIPYFLCAGSVLGAVRHQGFIPWDDDIDIGMLRKDYNRFLKVARTDLSEGYLLIDANDTPDYCMGYAKVVRDNTALVNAESSHLRMHHGFFVDLFPFDTIPEDVEKQNEMYQEARDIQNLFLRMRKWNNFTGKNPIKRYFANWEYYSLKRYSSKKVFDKMNQIVTQYLDSDSKLVADLFAPYNKKLFFKIEDIYPYKMMQFEDDVYPVPANPDAYLSVMYGDYMTLPPEDKRYVKHDIICFDTNKNYINDEKWMKKFYQKRGK